MTTLAEEEIRTAVNFSTGLVSVFMVPEPWIISPPLFSIVQPLVHVDEPPPPSQAARASAARRRDTPIRQWLITRASRLLRSPAIANVYSAATCRWDGGGIERPSA